MPPVVAIPDPIGDQGEPVALNDIDIIQTTPTTPSDITKTLAARSTSSTTTSAGSSAGSGSISPTNINMQGMLALFAILGASFVIASIWFFFWAKNGGFVWRRGDWEDYKSTVLRRKGPDGKTLSNATKSTKLGGGSINGYTDDGGTVTDMTETATTVTNEKGQQPRRKKKFRETAKEKLLRKRKEENWEGQGDDDMRAYRKEKPARVGGINAQGDTTYYGTDYTPSSPPTAYTESEMHEQHRHHPRYSEDRHHRDTRNVSGFSFTAGNEDVISQAAAEEHLIPDPTHARRETRRQQRPQQQATTDGRRSRHNSPRKREAPRGSMPGGYTEPLDFSSRGTNSEYQYSTVDTEDDAGTKSYHHPIPGLTKGYRRDRDGSGRRRRDSLSDSD
ncbi:hypothetical protein BGW36DRAFT_67915 [Talaromyces proteolyticus]|uniref:Endosomal spry domain-containing protein n=1 Tax=Talaromyces proteolyticus TaxID=1131652 RepID=A0AAD4KJW5_9EURO|nr:uncharacterized protein BGW36DRAFT_67915 [Talaromyces proteolyticus]KAH8690166.1 hypothetical protein BGW36DRAFT_67915 [Talaromyces proteolyticus]